MTLLAQEWGAASHLLLWGRVSPGSGPRWRICSMSCDVLQPRVTESLLWATKSTQPLAMGHPAGPLDTETCGSQPVVILCPGNTWPSLGSILFVTV
ncbi:hCG1785561 [Homo sapiens]|uniref:HCG1785561 n=1 Tax=Homo sapiens TaxID=9606 RepID=Q9BU82_HUMAN